MTPETLVVPRAPFDIEDPWSAPAAASPVRLRCATDASAPRLTTSVAVWYDRDCLSVLFSGADDHVVATHFAHDAPLYEEDVVELFLAPDGIREYYELEVSPRGTIFDARIVSPEGTRATMQVDRGWTCDGLMITICRITESDRAMSVDTLVRVPFASLGRGTPAPGEVWRANFFRIDRHPERGDEFSAWQATMRNPPDFHVPAAFGSLKFQ